MDGRADNKGTKGNKGGRPSKADELKLIERLTPMEDEALEQLRKGVKSGDFRFLSLYMSYMYGKPKESVKLEGSINIPISKWSEDE